MLKNSLDHPVVSESRSIRLRTLKFPRWCADKLCMSVSRNEKTPRVVDQRGFTLVEVMTTIVIMGILFSIATFSWQNAVEGRSVDSAANQVLADLRLLNTTATSRLGVASIKFNGTGGPISCNGQPDADYCLYQPTASGFTQKARYFESDKVKLNSPNILPASGPTVTADFKADGSATVPGTIGSIPGVTDSCPSSTPSGARRLQITVDGNPTHCLTINTGTSSVQLD